MLAIIQEKQTNIKVTSVVLESDPSNPEMMELFYCPKCRTALFQYSGHVVMIVPGATITNVPVIIVCRECKRRYLLNSIL